MTISHTLKYRPNEFLLIILLCLSAIILKNSNLSHTCLPAIGLLLGSFYHPKKAIAFLSLITLNTSFFTETREYTHLIADAIAGIVASLIAGKLTSREEFAQLSFKIAAIEGVITIILGVITKTPTEEIITQASISSFCAFGCSIVALGISPYLENIFDIVTKLRLVELSNLNRPLLQKLAQEAPGTFQHTLFVASLAEAAARELNCNVELVRAGTLYHDIGKLHDPSSFIENQINEVNKHDLINDPWESAKIIKKHISEGLIIAEKYRIPQAIKNFISEHQGKMLITYFYHQAQQQTEKPVIESDFRYQGPIPQSRETGILMLVDATEAALRSLKNPNPDIALSMVSKILKARWDDNQISQSGIKYEELPIIANVCLKVWQQHNHKRIAYPKITPIPLQTSNQTAQLSVAA